MLSPALGATSIATAVATIANASSTPVTAQPPLPPSTTPVTSSCTPVPRAGTAADRGGCGDEEGGVIQGTAADVLGGGVGGAEVSPAPHSGGSVEMLGASASPSSRQTRVRLPASPPSPSVSANRIRHPQM